MIEHGITPAIKKGTTVVLGMVVLRISRKYIRGADTSRSNVIPSARLLGYSTKNGYLAKMVISPKISKGVLKVVKFF